MTEGKGSRFTFHVLTKSLLFFRSRACVCVWFNLSRKSTFMTTVWLFFFFWHFVVEKLYMYDRGEQFFRCHAVPIKKRKRTFDNLHVEQLA